MKLLSICFLKVILFVILYQCNISKIYSQASWYWQQPLASGNLLNSADFLNSSTGIAVGVLGTIMKTTDGGITWSLKNSGTSNDLNKVFFAGKSTAFIAGKHGLILKTTDCGDSWSFQNISKLNTLNDIFFPSFNTGYIVGLTGTILKTTNNGTNWNKFTSGINSPLFCVSFLNNNTGVTGGYNLILKTTNGGINWMDMNVNIFPSGQIVGIVQSDSNTIIAAGNSPSGNIYKTTNGGLNWDRISSGLPYLFDGSVDLIRDISFLNKNTGFMVTDLGTILRTTDAGFHWVQDSTFRPSYLKLGVMKDISIVDSGRLCISGAGGTVFSSTNAGVDWLTSSGNKKDIRGHFFINEKIAYCVGESGSILKTEDSGTGWIYLDSETDRTLHSIFFVNKFTGYTAGDFGIIMKTTDEGLTWPTKTSGTFYNVYCIKFLNNDTGFAACGNEPNMNSKILKTTDGGENWFSIFEGISMGSLTSIEILSNTTIVISGKNGNILRSTNCGTDWSVTKITWEDFNSLSFSDSLNGIVAGNNGVIFRTADQGLDWQFISTGSHYKLNSVRCFNNNAVAAGENGTILTSTTGGSTWNKEQRITYNAFYSADIFNNSCFVFGEFGSIINSSGNNFSSDLNIKNITTDKTFSANYPNPFNPNTVISYSLESDKFVSVKIYDILGKEVLTLVNSIQHQGKHSVIWEASDFPGGVYLYTIKTNGFLADSGRMLLLK